MNEMTDKQMEVILNLVADKFAGCKDMDEVKKAIDEVRNMAKKEKPTDQALGNEREGGLATALNQKYYIIQILNYQGPPEMAVLLLCRTEKTFVDFSQNYQEKYTTVTLHETLR